MSHMLGMIVNKFIAEYTSVEYYPCDDIHYDNVAKPVISWQGHVMSR